jgi:hypothetical protein
MSARPSAVEHFGFLAGLFGPDAPAPRVITRELIGWRPTEPSLPHDRYHRE